MPVWDLGLELFRDTVVRSRKYPIRTHLYSTLLTQIQIEREGSVINRSAVKSNVDMLISLTHPKVGISISQRPTVYKQDFEPAFLATSAEFYRAEAERMLDTSDAAQYLRHVEKRFSEEEGRVAVYLSSSTDSALRTLLEKHLLTTHLQTILDMPGSGLVTMLHEDRRGDLGRLYRLFSRVADGPGALKSGLKAYVTSKGKLINEMVSSSVNAGAPSNAPKAAENVPEKTVEEGGDDAPTGDGEAPATKARGKAKAGVSAPDASASQASTPQAALALKWVEDVLAFKDKFDNILVTSFQDDKGCETAINEVSHARFARFIILNC